MTEFKKEGVRFDEFVIESDDGEGLGLRSDAPFEPEVLHSLREWIRPGALVLDIGANVGYFTAYMSKLVGSAGRVHAFEPEPRNFALLNRNIEANRLDNVTPYQIALGAREGTATLHISDSNAGMHRLYESVTCGERAIDVPVRTLDSMFAPGQVSVIKIDVEGFEPFVLSGAGRLIQGQQIAIVSEYCPPSMLEAGAGLSDFLLQLQQWRLGAFLPDGERLDWSALMDDARKWEHFGRERLVAELKGKSNPEIAALVEQQAQAMQCARPFIENLVFRSL